MGIQGLLPFLKKIHEPVNVSKFAGCTVAIDAYCWLHKGAFSCAEKLALGEKTDQYVYYCMKYINYLLSKNIKPVMVFDGCHLPSKKNVEKTRREKRELNRKKAAQFLREGKRAEARECLQRCIDISPEMALELMNACRDRGVDCIVAPYEADAQLAYLNKIGVAQLIITEDSDLLLFGCEKVMFKMDHAGNGILIEKERLNEVTEIPGGQYSFDKFRYMCILSGCDYLQSLTGIGLAKANKVFKVARQADVGQLLKKLSTYLKSNITVPQEYIDGFIAANNTFLYQYVYDPLQRKLVPLNPYSPDVNPEELGYAGAQIPAKKALQIALGNINIYSGEQFASFEPDAFQPKYVKKKPDMLHMLSIWDKNYRVKPRAVLHETQVPDRPSLKGKEVHVKMSLKKHSPHKRTREAEDSKDVKSDTELYSMYSSPEKKKRRTEPIDDDLHRFMFANKDEQSEDTEEESKQEPDEPSVKLGSPKFFHSLSKAHPDIKGDTAGSEGLEEKENGLLSPKRNIFMSKSPAKKPRFDLNAPKQKEVKSRFFAQSVTSKSSSKPDQRNTSSSMDSYKPIHSNSANLYNSGNNLSDEESEAKGQITTVLPNNSINCMELDDGSSVSVTRISNTVPFKFSRSQEVESSSPKSSPIGGSAFTWSRFKFNRHNSSDQVSQKLKNTQGVAKQFKKVVSESKLDSFLKKDQKNDQINLEDSDCEVVSLEIESQNNSEITSLGLSESQTSLRVSSSLESSFPYSIDSDCLTESDLRNSQSLNQLSQCQSQQDDLSQERTGNQRPDNIVLNKKKTSLSIYFQSSEKVSMLDSEINKRNSDYLSADNTAKGTEIKGDSSAELEVGNQERPVFLLDSDEEVDTTGTPTSTTNTKNVYTDNRSTLNKGKSKPGCRVSGLSKRSKKTVSTQENGVKQQNLKDMFAKFAHSKRLSSSASQDVDLEDFHTPEGSNSLVNKKMAVQMTLLK